MSFNIAIDGPAGAGKSTIAKAVAARLGFIYVDTGAMYRTIALYLLDHGIEGKDIAAIEAALPDISVELKYEESTQQVWLNGEDVSGRIRNEAVVNMASVASAHPPVRAKLLSLQQDMAAACDVIMDGRDIGTCILPNAQVKIFLTASVQERASRRYKELCAKGVDCDLEAIAADIAQRDYQDSHREVSPLRQAEDAILVDSSAMTIEEVIEAIISIVKEKL